MVLISLIAFYKFCNSNEFWIVIHQLMITNLIAIYSWEVPIYLELFNLSVMFLPSSSMHNFHLMNYFHSRFFGSYFISNVINFVLRLSVFVINGLFPLFTKLLFSWDYIDKIISLLLWITGKKVEHTCNLNIVKFKNYEIFN